MKAVVVEINDRHAVVLDKSGCFRKVNYGANVSVGQEIEYNAKAAFNFARLVRLASAAAILLVASLTGYGAYSYYTPYSYINVDINPSVEVAANKYDRVIKAEGLNDDGKKLLEDIKVENKKVEDAIDSIIGKAVDTGYMNVELGNTLMVTVSGKNSTRVDQLESDLGTAVKKVFRDSDIEEDEALVVGEATLQKHDEAREIGISPGKLTLIERLLETSPELEIGQLKDKPVKEIMSSIKTDRIEAAADKQSSKDNAGYNSEASGDNSSKDANDIENRTDKENGQGSKNDNDNKDNNGNGKIKVGDTSSEVQGNVTINNNKDDTGTTADSDESSGWNNGNGKNTDWEDKNTGSSSSWSNGNIDNSKENNGNSNRNGNGSDEWKDDKDNQSRGNFLGSRNKLR